MEILPQATKAILPNTIFPNRGDWEETTQHLQSTGEKSLILLVDPDTDMRDYVKGMLENLYRVEAVGDKVTAWVAIAQQIPDLVLSDMMMPGLEALELLRELRDDSRTREIPMILFSPSVGEEYCIEALETGADDYLIQPFSERQLQARIYANLRKSRICKLAFKNEQSAKAEAVKAHQEIAQILERITDGFFALDKDWCFTYLNYKSEQFLHQNRKELIGKNLWQEFPESQETAFELLAKKAVSENISLQIKEFCSPLNAWIECYFYPSSSGLSIYFRDITLRKQVQEELRETNQRLDSLITASPLAIITLDASGKLKMWSPAAEQIFGWKKEEVIDCFPPFVPPEKQQEFDDLHRNSILQGKHLAGLELKYCRKSGEEIDIAIWVAPLHDGQDNWCGTMAIMADISDRKEAEIEKERLIQLLESEQGHLEAVLQQMPAAAIIAEAPSGKLLLGNKLVEKIWRQPFLAADNIVEYQNYKGFYPDGKHYKPEEWPLARSIRNGEVVTDEEINFQRGDGTLGTMSVSSTPIHNYEGKIIAGVMTFYDITEQKRAREELQASEERFRILVNSMQDIVFTLDREQRYTGVFGSWWSKTETQKERFLGKTLPEILGADSAMIHESANRKALAGETVVYEWSFESAIGTQYCQTSLSPMRNIKGEVTGVVGVGRDITQLHRAKEAQRLLAEASRVLTASLDYETTLKSVARMAVPDLADYCVIFVVDEREEIRRVAVAHRDPVKELLLKELQKYPINPNSEAPVVQVLRSARSLVVREVSDAIFDAISYEVNQQQILQQLSPKSFMLVPLVARGKTLGAISFSSAESGRRYEESDLVLVEDLAYRAALAFDNALLYRKAQEANRIKDEFLAIVSHELRTPLNSILGWSTLLRTRKFDETMTARALETIERNARSQSQLIEDLLDVSRMLRGKLSLNFHTVDLVAVVEAATQAISPMAQTNNIELGLKLASNDCFVSGDFNRLQQIVWNLLSNAIKFTPPEGRVEIRLERIEEGSKDEKDATPLPLLTLARITVSDTGKGISPDFLPYVFERFRQADSTTTRTYGGLGLGLAIVRHLVELHGGSVCAASDGEEKGAIFTVNLPLLKGAKEGMLSVKNYTADSISHSALLGLQILVVDDDEDTRNFLTTALQEYGAKVTAVGSAGEALEALEGLRVDVLVSDIGMPGEDGYALIGKVRAKEVKEGGMLPAVALTAYAMESDRIKALDAGFQCHLPKPVAAVDLVEVVKQLLNDKYRSR